MSRPADYLKLTLLAALCGALGLLSLRYLAIRDCRDTHAPPPATPGCVRVLFVGNSYTFFNDLPGTLARLAEAGGHTAVTAMAAEGGWRLADHAGAPQTRAAIASSSWHYVVLQEQSQIPSVAELRASFMEPAARALAEQISASGATPLFFVTWGHRGGWPERGLASYQRMQAGISRGYGAIAGELGAPLAPVGDAWRLALREHPELDLWQADGSHPSEQGTYLAACVFYAVIFRQSPEGLGYTAGLPADTARILQAAAARVVLVQGSASDGR